MPGDLEGYDDRSRLRISDDDRHRVADVLRQAAGEGRLDIEELDARLEAAYAAKTYADLVPITGDLPVTALDQQTAVRRPAAALPAVRYASSWAVMGSASRRGVWEIGESYTAVGVMGGIDLDLREAVFTARETVINVYAYWAGVDIVVDEHTRVVVDGIGVMGAFEQGRDKVEAQLDAGSPVVRVTGVALMAGVTVRRKARPDGRGGSRRRMLGR
jgi:hypothetical protein